jgi:A/G-specific adenine glycosylase
MLQQTQVARVLAAYLRFLRRFPSLRALGRASLGEVLIEWDGLGYPRRARDLHRIARSTARLPRTVEALDALPGVGEYTAGAVACFSGGAAVPFADTNIRRVLGRVILGRTATPREALAIDSALMPPNDAARWHHALMDLGATVCVARSPHCDACPVRGLCRSRGRDRGVARARPRQAFGASDRRIRGAIMRILRSRLSVAGPRRRVRGSNTGGVPVAQLERTVGDARVPRLVVALAEEGLLDLRQGVARLP